MPPSTHPGRDSLAGRERLQPWRWPFGEAKPPRPKSVWQRAVFLDRDGTLIRHVPHLKDPRLVELLPGVGAALRELRDWYRPALVLVSNQASVGRGLQSEDELRAVHLRLVALLEQADIRLDAAYYCPHRAEAGCPCRKPGAAMIELAAHELGIDPRASFMIGDQLSDVAAGKRAGCTTVLLASEAWEANHRAPAWSGIVGLLTGSG